MRKKKTIQKLKLYMNNTFVGLLQKNPNGSLYFSYDIGWINSPDSIPLSLSMPLSPITYSGDVVINYFDNLLPDNLGIRKTLSQRFSIPTQEVYDLLSVIGKDCIGAVQLISDNEKIERYKKIKSKPISEIEIESILKNLKSHPFGLNPESDFRISVAGVQEKTAFLKNKNGWYIPLGTTPSTHIFKIQMGVVGDKIDMTQSIENEWLCLKICKHFGLPVANAEMINFGQVKSLVVERFDRIKMKEKILRYAQEDFCQVFGVSSNQKYENQGGPGIVQIIDALTKSDNPRVDKYIFMKAQVVFWLLAAIDGHAKNFSVFIFPDGIRLTPIYDVLSAYPPIKLGQIQYEKAKFAMAIGDNRHYKLKEIQRRHWLQTAKKANYPLGEMSRILEEVADQTSSVVDLVSKSLPDNFPSKISKPIFEGMLKASKSL